MPKGKKPEGGASIQKIFQEKPELLRGRKNEEILKRWAAHHGEGTKGSLLDSSASTLGVSELAMEQICELAGIIVPDPTTFRLDAQQEADVAAVVVELFSRVYRDKPATVPDLANKLTLSENEFLAIACKSGLNVDSHSLLEPADQLCIVCYMEWRKGNPGAFARELRIPLGELIALCHRFNVREIRVTDNGYEAPLLTMKNRADIRQMLEMGKARGDIQGCKPGADTSERPAFCTREFSSLLDVEQAIVECACQIVGIDARDDFGRLDAEQQDHVTAEIDKWFQLVTERCTLGELACRLKLPPEELLTMCRRAPYLAMPDIQLESLVEDHTQLEILAAIESEYRSVRLDEHARKLGMTDDELMALCRQARIKAKDQTHVLSIYDQNAINSLLKKRNQAATQTPPSTVVRRHAADVPLAGWQPELGPLREMVSDLGIPDSEINCVCQLAGIYVADSTTEFSGGFEQRCAIVQVVSQLFSRIFLDKAASIPGLASKLKLSNEELLSVAHECGLDVTLNGVLEPVDQFALVCRMEWVKGKIGAVDFARELGVPVGELIAWCHCFGIAEDSSYLNTAQKAHIWWLLKTLRDVPRSCYVHELVRDLNVKSGYVVNLCRQAGFSVRNHSSNLSREETDVIVRLHLNEHARKQRRTNEELMATKQQLAIDSLLRAAVAVPTPSPGPATVQLPVGYSRRRDSAGVPLPVLRGMRAPRYSRGQDAAGPPAASAAPGSATASPADSAPAPAADPPVASPAAGPPPMPIAVKPGFRLYALSWVRYWAGNGMRRVAGNEAFRKWQSNATTLLSGANVDNWGAWRDLEHLLGQALANEFLVLLQEWDMTDIEHHGARAEHPAPRLDSEPLRARGHRSQKPR